MNRTAPFRPLLVCLALLALTLAWGAMWRLSSQAPWYRDANMDVHTISNALSLNSGSALGLMEHPGSTGILALGLDLRLRHDLGSRDVWTMKRFARSADPLAELAGLVEAGRSHSRVLVILIIVLGALMTGHITRSFDAACLATALFAGCTGLLYHGLLLRPELLSAAFGLVSLYAGWLAWGPPAPSRRTGWLFLAGVALGLSVLSHRAGVFHLLPLLAWCSLAPRPEPSAGPPVQPAASWLVAAGLAATIVSLFALHRLGPLLLPETSGRLRSLAVLTAVIPFATFTGTAGQKWARLTRFVSDLGLVLSGLLLAGAGWFALLHTTLPTGVAADHYARVLNAVVYADSAFRLAFPDSETHRLREAIRFILDAPGLIVSASLLTAALWFAPRVPMRQRLFAGLLVIHALAMLLILSMGRHAAESSVYVELPLLLASCTALGALYVWWRGHAPEREHRWPVALALTAGFMLLLTAPLALRNKYPPVVGRVPLDDGILVTYLYDHDVHPRSYLDAMSSRYATRPAFTEAMNRFLRTTAKPPGGPRP